MKTIKTSEDYILSSKDILFFDTNIWLNLFLPTGTKENKETKEKIKKVSRIYKDVCEKSIKVYISSIVVSEFFNRYLRLMFDAEYSEDPSRYPNKDFKKEFKGTEEYVKYVNDIIEVLETNILPNTELLDDNFNRFTLKEFKEKRNIRYYDFNDFYIHKLCKDKNLLVVTGDNDFMMANSGVNVLIVR